MGDPIEIFDPTDTRVWKGHVNKLSIRWLGDDGWNIKSLSGVSLEALYDGIEIEKIKFAGVTCAAAFTTLFGLAGVSGVGMGTITGSTVIESLEVSNILQGFDQIALLSGGVWYIDPLDANIYLHAPVARAAAWTVESEHILWETMEWNQDRSDVRNEQVLQLPGVSMEPVIETFAGDDSTTVFTLGTVPQYIISITASIGMFARTSAWVPGSDTVSITPALPAGSTLTIRYSDAGLVSESVPATAAGSRMARYTRTSSFTPEGATQEATAILARYSMLPATLELSTDKPGIQIARKLTIDVTDPEGAGLLINGNWLVKEVNGFIVPGLDQLEEPFGHFRYRVLLINTAATAIFQGDGVTETFELPVTPESIQSIRVPEGHEGEWLEPTQFFSIVPAMADGESAAVDYIDPVNSPDVPSFINTWEDMGPTGLGDPVVLSSDPPGTVPGEEISQQTFIRTLTFFDLVVSEDAAPHTLVYNAGTGYRLLAVLRKEITADLTIRLNKGTQFALEELITVTIPSTAVINDTFDWPLAQGSPPILVPFFDKEILTVEVLASDGSTDSNSIAQFTVQWTKNPIKLEE